MTVRIHVEADPLEVDAKREHMVKALANSLGLSDADLVKACAPDEPQLRYPVLKKLQKEGALRYRKRVVAMLKEINAVLDQPLQKSEAVDDFTKVVADKAQAEYDAVKAELLNFVGYYEDDFAEGGVLYGMSVKELRALVQKRKEEAKP